MYIFVCIYIRDTSPKPRDVIFKQRPYKIHLWGKTEDILISTIQIHVSIDKHFIFLFWPFHKAMFALNLFSVYFKSTWHKYA